VSCPVPRKKKEKDIIINKEQEERNGETKHSHFKNQKTKTGIIDQS
jgi:hypothetical protein